MFPNDAILTRMFVGTLKGVSFDWFMKIVPGSIKSWNNLKKLYLSRFFEDDSEISMTTLLATK